MVQYLATDHLGSTSLVPDGQGGKVTESRHYPYGEERWSSGTQTTIVSPGSSTIPLVVSSIGPWAPIYRRRRPS